MKTSKIYRAFAIIGAAVLIFFLIRHFGLSHHLTLQGLKENQALFSDFYNEHPAATLLIYFTLYVLITSLSLPGAAVLTLCGGAIFGLIVGTLIVSFASALGATGAFLVSRYLLHDWVKKKFGKKLETINNGVRKEGAFYLFTLRLVPAVPFFLINLLMGLTPMSVRTYYWISQVGMLPGAIAYVNAGTQLGKINAMNEIFTPTLMLSFAVLGFLPLISKKLIDWMKK